MIAPRTLLLSLAISAALAGCATPGANPAADIRVPAAWGQTSAPTEAQPLDVTAPAADIAADGWWRGFNNAQLDALIDQVLAAQPAALADVRNGVGKATGFLIGQVMQASQGKANPKLIKELLAKRL